MGLRDELIAGVRRRIAESDAQEAADREARRPEQLAACIERVGKVIGMPITEEQVTTLTMNRPHSAYACVTVEDMSLSWESNNDVRLFLAVCPKCDLRVYSEPRRDRSDLAWTLLRAADDGPLTVASHYCYPTLKEGASAPEPEPEPTSGDRLLAALATWIADQGGFTALLSQH